MTFDIIMWCVFCGIAAVVLCIENKDKRNSAMIFLVLFLGLWFYLNRTLPALYR